MKVRTGHLIPMQAVIQHLSTPREEELKETTAKELLDGNYKITIETYLTYCWAKIRDRDEQLVASIQVEVPLLWCSEFGDRFVVVGRNDGLIDLKKRSYRKLDTSVLHWQHVYLSPDETILLVTGGHLFDSQVHAFYDLTGPEIKKLEDPRLSIFIPGPDDFKDDGSPSDSAYAVTKLEWQPDGRLTWIDEQPYYTDLQMWHYEADDHIDRLFPISSGDLLNPKVERDHQMEKEKFEWRVHTTTILKRDGDKMVVA